MAAIAFNTLSNAMGKYRIAWLLGDGVGIEVLAAARVVLEKLQLDAEYIHGDIGWEFWCVRMRQLFDLKITGKSFPIMPLPKSRLAIVDAGGLIPYTRSRLLQTALTISRA